MDAFELACRLEQQKEVMSTRRLPVTRPEARTSEVLKRRHLRTGTALDHEFSSSSAMRIARTA